MSFGEFMARMESYYPELKAHREYEPHNDPDRCRSCIWLMRRISDRGRYMECRYPDHPDYGNDVPENATALHIKPE